MKNLLLVTPYFYPAVSFGGPATATYGLAKEMTRKGYQVTVLTTDIDRDGKRVDKNKIDEDFFVYYARSNFPKLAWKSKLFLSLDQVIKSRTLIKNADVVHFQDFFIPQNYFISLFCRLQKKPYLITPHNSFTFNRVRGKVVRKKLFYHLFAKSLVKHANKIVAVSETEKIRISEEFPQYSHKTIFIPNIIADKKRTGNINVRKNLNISEETIIYLYLGRLDRLKGVVDLINGFFLFIKNKEGAEVALLFAGPNMGVLQELEAILEKKKIKNKVYFVGEVDGNLKQACLKQSNILCLTSYSEGLPTVVLEATSNRKPCIFTLECNVKGLATSNGGLMVDHKPLSISKAMDKLYLDSKKRQKMGDNAYRWYTNNFSPKLIGKRYEETYNQLG